MSPPVLTFFNNKGGVGKTSLVYHLSWMFAKMGKTVVVTDLDPQANLTAAFLEDDQLEALWDNGIPGATIYQCVRPLGEVGDILEPTLQTIGEGLFLMPGDVCLSSFEEILSEEWPKSMDERNLYRRIRVLSSFWQVMQMAGKKVAADMILVDVGPNLGAINRAALIATDYVVIPLGADLFSLQGLKNLGPTLVNWRRLWAKRLDNWKDSGDRKDYPDFRLPKGEMQPIGYLCQQHSVRLDRPVKAYDKWVNRIPGVYRKAVLEDENAEAPALAQDPYCLATIKHYRSLIPMSQEHRKPIFCLTSADGAIGSHANAVKDAKADFRDLAQKISQKIGVSL